VTKLVEIRLTDSEGSVLADVSSAGELVAMSQRIVAVGNTEVTGNAYSEVSRSKVVASSVDSYTLITAHVIYA
jgi:hypothetical protein